MTKWLGIALVVALATASTASAFSTYRPRIPNGNTLSCIACHATTAGGDPINGPGWNVFGHDVLAQDPDVLPADLETDNENVNYNGQLPAWDATLCGEDSDGDGQTNGQELGDPDCIWTVTTPATAAPRTTDISRPGDPDSLSANPDGIDPPPVGEGEGEGEGEGDGAEGEGEGEGDGGGGGDDDDDDDGGGCASAAPTAGLPLTALLVPLAIARRRRPR